MKLEKQRFLERQNVYLYLYSVLTENEITQPVQPSQSQVTQPRYQIVSSVESAQSIWQMARQFDQFVVSKVKIVESG